MTTMPANPNRFSDTLSLHRKPTYTSPHTLLMNRLNQEHIDYLSEHPLEREGEFDQTGAPKFWSIDIFIRPKLCVEVDGVVHWKYARRRKQDERKERWLELHGYVLRRFGNYQVQHNLDTVIKLIREAMVL